MTGEPASAPAVRDAVVAEIRARHELDVDPDELEVAVRPAVAPGIDLYAARAGEPRQRVALAGAIIDGVLDTAPRDALDEVWRRWLAGDGLPDPNTVAEVAAFLLSSGGASVQGDPPPAALADGIGVTFRWKRRSGPGDVTLRWDGDDDGVGEVVLSERTDV